MNDLKFEKFIDRHVGPRDNDIQEMLKIIGTSSLDSLIEETIPTDILLEKKFTVDSNNGEPLSEFEFLNELKKTSLKNKKFRSYIGMGYYSSITPAVIQRNILENPGWYTQYTPYQAEISQGRLEALINFQTVISDLTGLPIANASLLDEGTAAAEAMLMLRANRKDQKKNCILVSNKCFPQTIDVIKTRALPFNIEVKVEDISVENLDEQAFAILVQYPDVFGEITDFSNLFLKAKEKNIKIIVAADILSLALLTPPGEFGADVVVGNTQRLGVPLGYGGPHAAYFAVRDEYKRVIPGRIIGISIDADGNKAFRMALQTREQHIRREKATSNICTAQVLLAIMASMYAVYHGPKGIRKIAERIHKLTNILNFGLKELGYEVLNKNYFDTLYIKFDNDKLKNKINEIALQKEINFNYCFDNSILISLDECTTIDEVKKIIEIFAKAKSVKVFKVDTDRKIEITFDKQFIRTSEYLTHPVFDVYHSEHEMLRYIKRLENKDLSLTTSMIPLGSCTMKLNASTEMYGISFSEFANIHPFVPEDQVLGYQEIIDQLANALEQITGFDAVSFQPNSGAQGEYTGLMVIRTYLHHTGQSHRNVVLIPASAHGTNPASAVMAGMKVVVVNCDEKGNIDINDLKLKANENEKNLAAIMVTYPSTHGVFESNIKEITGIIHKAGGQVYMDGANMNAQVGLTSPKMIEADVCHINLHKTFCIPHGGGGPGMGPIAVAKHLTPFLPTHFVSKVKNENAMTAVASAPYGSANILLISLAYIKMTGYEGLKKATQVAILNANYLKSRLEKYYKVLYFGEKGRVGHELIFDVREFKHKANVDVEDIAKRLMDYGFHAPTVSFPVPGTLMVEPTESESKEELDRFCDAMISIYEEMNEIINGKLDKDDNMLRNAPHTAKHCLTDKWEHKYSRERAAYPSEWVKKNKFWPSVSRINNAYGDRNLICSCEPIENYK